MDRGTTCPPGSGEPEALMARLQQTIAVEGFALVVLLQELGDLPAQEQQGDEVRDDHDPVEEVRELPDETIQLRQPITSPRTDTTQPFRTAG